MNAAVLLELSRCWKRNARAPDVESGGKDAKVPSTIARGERQALRACADTLRTLVQMLGEGNRNQPLYIAKQASAERN